MNEILNKETLSSVAPSEIISYLKGTGWNKITEVTEKHLVFWGKTERQTDFDLMVPLRKQFTDYSSRVGEIFKTLETIEARPISQIFYDLKNSTSDILRIRISHPSSSAGDLPLNGTLLLMDGANELISSAALSTTENKAYHPRVTNFANDFLKKLRAGQTEKGSYIIKIITPIPPNNQASLFPDFIDDPIERKLTKNLIIALRACQDASERSVVDGNIDTFRTKISSGVSANLLDAVVKMGSIFDVNDVEFSVTWSMNREAPQGIGTTPINLQSHFMTYMKEASRVLKETSPIDAFELSGHVEKLNQPMGAETATVTIVAQVEGSYHKIRTELRGDDHRQAIRAYEDKSIVKCTGELIRDGRSYKLDNPRGFRILSLAE